MRIRDYLAVAALSVAAISCTGDKPTEPEPDMKPDITLEQRLEETPEVEKKVPELSPEYLRVKRVFDECTDAVRERDLNRFVKVWYGHVVESNVPKDNILYPVTEKHKVPIFNSLFNQVVLSMVYGIDPRTIDGHQPDLLTQYSHERLGDFCRNFPDSNKRTDTLDDYCSITVVFNEDELREVKEDTIKLDSVEHVVLRYYPSLDITSVSYYPGESNDEDPNGELRCGSVSSTRMDFTDFDGDGLNSGADILTNSLLFPTTETLNCGAKGYQEILKRTHRILRKRYDGSLFKPVH